MALETKYVCQAYAKNKGGHLEIAGVHECTSAGAAEIRARKLWDSGHYVGVDAFRVSADPDAGEYDEPTFILRLGEGPPEG